MRDGKSPPLNDDNLNPQVNAISSSMPAGLFMTRRDRQCPFSYRKDGENVQSSKREKPSLEVAPTALATFSSCDLELWPTTLNFEFDLENVKNNYRPDKYLGQS